MVNFSKVSIGAEQLSAPAEKPTPKNDRASRHLHPEASQASDYMELPLTQGKIALVSAIDYPELAKYRWCWGGHYAMRKDSLKKTVYLHRQVLGFPTAAVDHINRNVLDNRRQNLREASSAQNCANSRLPITNTSGYRGVFKKRAKWAAQISVNNKSVYLGAFNSIKEAAKAYNTAAESHFGQFAVLNDV